MNVEELRARYLEFQLDGHPDLTEFLDRVVQGGYGPVPRQVLAEFLDLVEADIVNSVETMAASHPGLGPQKEEVLASQLEWLRRLRAKYLGDEQHSE